MSVYAIGCDLLKARSGYDYRPLHDELRRFGGHRIQQSLWLVSLPNTPQEVLQHFSKFIAEHDRMWVMELFMGHYAFNLALKGTNHWIINNNPRSGRV